MKKSDLRSGMVVVNREGAKGIVLLGTEKGNIIGGFGSLSGQAFWMPFDCITDDLCYANAGFSRSDIVAVYTANSNQQFGSMDLDKLRLLWQRPADPIELTIEEIADRFGVDPALIRIKKD